MEFGKRHDTTVRMDFWPRQLVTALCEEYQELTPFLGFVHVLLIQESHIFQWADKKIRLATLHQIFRICRGHKGGHNDTHLRKFDEGILRGKGEKKIF